MTMKLRPLSDRIAVRKLARDEKTPGGIIIPATADDDRKAWQGVVMAAGPGRVTEEGRRIEPGVKTGDRVLVGKYSGSEVELDGQKVAMVREADILGIMEE